ncbi:MAG: TrmB family transcriptional regulator [Desulfobacteraceae bacterium]|nr:TrmB family transcriptional regulator [Desulfobacteraceae bacterium]
MDIASLLRDFAFSKYESSAYLALLTHHPTNGSQLSKRSGIARSRIYDVLRGLMAKGIVFEVEHGQYVPLPFEELKKRLRHRFESNLTVLEEKLQSMAGDSGYEYLMTLKGYTEVIKKAEDIIGSATHEMYIRLFPRTWERLKVAIKAAVSRGVGVRMVSMGDIPLAYDIQVNHPFGERLIKKIGGESIDIIVDKAEAIVGIFETGISDVSPIIWTRNRWFVTANRDSVRHDFYHYFLDKIYECSEPLTEREKKIYEFIKADD